MAWSLDTTENNFNSIMRECVSPHTKFTCTVEGFVSATYKGRITRTFAIDRRTLLEQCNDIHHIMVMACHQSTRDSVSVIVSRLTSTLHLPD
jgi:hypothetical protein